MRLRYTEKAKEDIEIAFSWYEEQQHGLWFDFLDCLEETVKTVIETRPGYMASTIPSSDGP